MLIKTCLSPLTLAIILLLGTSTTAWADPPSRVGRLSYNEGEVAFYTQAQGQWTQATLNYPIVAGESFWTAANAKAEIQIGSAEIRMDQATEIDVLRLDDDATQIKVPQGIINVHLRTQPLAPIQIITPLGEVDLAQAGSYHIDSGHPDASPASYHTSITVLEGGAQMQGLASALVIMPGESAVLSGYPVSVTLQEGNTTDFDNWALARQYREADMESAHYVSAETTGMVDLDAYGHWAPNPDYGTIWYPASVPTEWAPYRYGQWVYIAPWGWTWADNAPWGFAPFHYGRWVNVNKKWGWCPGEIVQRPVYAPALVAFVGGAGGNAVSSGNNPNIGWVPLAPNEVFHPYYPVSTHYIRNINSTNVNKAMINTITVNNVTVNKYINQPAVTVAPASSFAKDALAHSLPLAVAPAQTGKVSIAINPLLTVTHTNIPINNAAPVHPVIMGHEQIAAQKPLLQHVDVQNYTAIPHKAMHVEPEASVYHPINLPVKEQKIIYPAAPEIHAEKTLSNALPTNIAHPVQKTQMQPTPQGWTRVPGEQQHKQPDKPVPTKEEQKNLSHIRENN